MTVTLIAIFIAGIANFALHRWLLESGHVLVVNAVAPIQRVLGRHATYVIEFALLAGALAWATRSWFPPMMLYGAYTAINAATVAWIKGMEE